MENFMSKFIKSSILSSIALVVLGALLFFQSELTIVSISYIIGAVLVGIGVVAMLKFILNKNAKNELDIVYGIVTVILGIVVITNPKAIASIIPFILGILIVISSATKLGYGFELKRAKNDLWIGTVIIALVTLICGMLLLFNPFAGAKFILKVVGALIFTYGILDIISTIRIRKTIKPLVNALEKGANVAIVEAEVIEDNTDVDKKKEKKNKKKKAGDE